MSTNSASNPTAPHHVNTEVYSMQCRPSMSSSARSTFESMVFHSSTLVQAPTTAQTGGRIYGTVENIHPSGVAKHSVGDSCHERRHDMLFTKEHLFEVAVMYLFNGIKPTHTPTGQKEKLGTMELLHYLAYIVPEADKLHVTDLNGHPEHVDRMEHVRVIFDPIDFRFRVIVKRTGSTGWVDISLQLRNTFTRQRTRYTGNLSGLWVPMVSQLRESLVRTLAFHTGHTVTRVSSWLTAPEDIMWEVPHYGADLTGMRDLFEDMKAKRGQHDATMRANGHDEPLLPLKEEAPFIVSYWADNYLQIDSYKVARMFNGLVGYGEFLYDHENNYTKAHVNNFFIGGEPRRVDPKVDPASSGVAAGGEDTGDKGPPGPGDEPDKDHPGPAEKTWLWADMPYGDPHGPVRAAAATGTGPGQTVASLKERTRVLEAFFEGDKLHLAEGFRVIVARRHHSTMQALQGELLLALVTEHGNAGSRVSYADLGEAVDLFVRQFDPFGKHSRVTEDASEGHLHKDILKTTCDELRGTLQQYLLHKGKAHGPVELSMQKMLATKIHIARETWLLDKHTCQMEEAQLEAIQQTYYTGFWDSMYDNTERDRPALPDDTAPATQHVGMRNNSSLKQAYMDGALSTYEVGYARAARTAGLVCDAFWNRVAPSVMQGYYDRKTTSDSQADFIGHVDLTSLLRSSNSLVRTFDNLMRDMKPDKHTLQTTRTMFAAQGQYFVLQGGKSVYSSMAGTTGGRRRTHADDLVTFSFALCTMVDNPGIWNLLASPRELASARGFYPKVANNGFVVSGYPIQNSRTRAHGRVSADEVSWEHVADMTFRKLQVGIMQLPDNRNQARVYLHEIINNTRHTSSSSTQHSFESFMRGLYNSQAYQSCLQDAPGEDSSSSSSTTADDMRRELEAQGNNFVGRLCACCWDANMQVAEPAGENYAFSALHKLGVKLPTDPDAPVTASSPDVRYKCLFYILFGETIARWMADVRSVRPLTPHEQQKVQEKNHLSVSAAYQNQLRVFLETLTLRFFSGELHSALTTTLWERFPAEQAVPGSAAAPPHPPLAEPAFADLSPDMTAIVMRTRNLPNLEEHCIKDHRKWRSVPPSAKAIKADVQASLLGVPALEAQKKAEELREYLRENAELQAQQEAATLLQGETQEPAQAPPMSFVQLQALEAKQLRDEAEIEKLDLRHAREVFSPYLDVYRQVVAFHKLSEESKPANEVWRVPGTAPHRQEDLDEQTQHFFENRMLVMAVCEEQMHLIQRHYTVERDFGGNVAWCLLFSMFLYHRQEFAQLY